MQKIFMLFKIYSKVIKMEKNRVVSINKNKKPDIDSPEFLSMILESFPRIERDILKLTMGLDNRVIYESDKLSEQLNQPKEKIDKALASGLKRLRDIFQKEKIKAENEDAYNEIRLQMHNKLIKKLRSLKEEWELDNISQVTERIILAFFKDDLE